MSKYYLIALEAAINDQNESAINEIATALSNGNEIPYVADKDIVHKVWRSAARCGTPELIQKLANLANANLTQFSNNDSVAVAARHQKFSNVRALAEIGMDVNFFHGGSNSSVLQIIIPEGNIEMVKFIVQKVKEKEPKETLRDVQDSFICACRFGHLEIVKYFLEELYDFFSHISHSRHLLPKYTIQYKRVIEINLKYLKNIIQKHFL
jgi:ankyrin repeat protein